MSEHLAPPPAGSRMHQGDLIRDVEVPLLVGTQTRDGERAPLVELRKVPWLMVGAQDCDLELDFLARNNLPASEGGTPVSGDKTIWGMLVAPGWPAEDVYAGVYVDGVSRIPNARKLAIERHDAPRFYHVGTDDLTEHQALVFDLKYFSTVPPAWAEAEWHGARVARLNSPWREHMLQHITNYLGRVALPEFE